MWVLVAVLLESHEAVGSGRGSGLMQLQNHNQQTRVSQMVSKRGDSHSPGSAESQKRVLRYLIIVRTYLNNFNISLLGLRSPPSVMHTTQLLLTGHQSEFGYLGGRWDPSSVTCYWANAVWVGDCIQGEGNAGWSSWAESRRQRGKHRPGPHRSPGHHHQFYTSCTLYCTDGFSMGRQGTVA